MTRLLLVRHAESEWNAAGRWQGQADPPLSTFGRQQARQAALPEPVDVVVSSPLVRAHETASIIAEQLGLDVAETIVDLQERAAGQWTGLTRAEIDDLSPGWLGNGATPAGYESDDAVCRRARSVLLDLAACYGEATLLVVTHGGLIGAINGSLTARGSARRPRFSNLCGAIIGSAAGQLTAAGTIRLVDPAVEPLSQPQ